jgi:hypothetical protein
MSQPPPPPRRYAARLHFAGRRRDSGGCLWLLHERCVFGLCSSLSSLSGRSACCCGRPETVDMLVGAATTHQASQVSLNPVRESYRCPLCSYAAARPQSAGAVNSCATSMVCEPELPSAAANRRLCWSRTSGTNRCETAQCPTRLSKKSLPLRTGPCTDHRQTTTFKGPADCIGLGSAGGGR